MPDVYGQGDYRVRLDWGRLPAQTNSADVAVVVDVLSFSTSVCIAVERGMEVHPSPWRGSQAEAFAQQHGATLAVGRLEARRDGIPLPSLSPADLLVCPPVRRLVLPSPNGSTIAATLRDRDATVIAGCLRNATAVAERLATDLGEGRTVLIIAAGERWARDDSLRPALEDQLGAGAILSALAELGCSEAMSPEAAAAVGLFRAGRDRFVDWMRDCVSGRELAERDFGPDVAAASALDASRVVPILVDGWFTAA